VILQNGVATLTTKILTLGTHTLTASYAGNDTFGASTSAPLMHRVVKGNPKLTTTSSPSHPAYGDSVAFSISVAAADPSVSGVPTGTVTLSVNGTAVQTAPLDAAGGATIPVPLMTAGSHAVAITYSGDVGFEAATSTMTQVVAKAATLVSVESSANPAAPDAPVVLTVRVSTPGHPAPPAEGMVMVSSNGTLMSQQHLEAGAASVRVQNMSEGEHELTTDYPGDENFDRSTATLMQIVGTTPALSITSARFAEGDVAHEEVIRVELSSASMETVLVDYRMVGKTASPGVDYIGGYGTLTFAPGQTSQTITIRILGDREPEPDETFTVELSRAAGATIATTSATVAIVNDDVRTRARSVRH
jgi:hypothetical protein